MRVLILSPYFAPYKGVGALRMTNLAEYLLNKNIEITVIKQKCDESVRCELLDKIECITVEAREKTAKSIKESYESAINNVCEKNTFNCCIATFGPYYYINSAIRIKETYGIPLIVDYRDLWLYDPRPAKSFFQWTTIIYMRLCNKRYEKKLMEVCDAFVSVTEGCVRIMSERYPAINGKNYCVHNGYSIKETLSNEFNGDTHIVCFLGKLAYYSESGAELIFKAINRLRSEGFAIRIWHIGEPEIIQNYLKKHHLEEAYDELGQLPYKEAMAKASEASVFAEVINYKIGLGTKVFDYIALNKPLIAIAPTDSELEKLLSGEKNVCITQQYKDIYDFLHKVFTKKIGYMTKDCAWREQFSREKQNEKYLSIIKKIVYG